MDSITLLIVQKFERTPYQLRTASTKYWHSVYLEENILIYFPNNIFILPL